MIIAKLTIQTATRPGTMANVTIHDFRTMREVQVSKVRVMLIPDHKHGVVGPGPVTLTAEMQKKMEAYLTHILPQFRPSSDVDRLFVMSDRKPFVGGTIYRRITEMWRKSGVRLDLCNCHKHLQMDCHGLPPKKE